MGVSQKLLGLIQADPLLYTLDSSRNWQSSDLSQRSSCQKVGSFPRGALAQTMAQDPQNALLIANVARFERVVADPQEHLIDHHDVTIPWEKNAIATSGNFGDVTAEAV